MRATFVPVIGAMACAIVCGCASGAAVAASGAVQEAAAGASPDVRVRVVAASTTAPAVGQAAINAFRPDVAASDSGGECALHNATGSASATVATAYFPNRAAPLMNVSLIFDSVGHLVRYSEIRGVTGLRGVSPDVSDIQRDSLLRAAEAATRTTAISLDYATNQGTARNRGGGKPDRAVAATARELELLVVLGPVKERLGRVRKLCGV